MNNSTNDTNPTLINLINIIEIIVRILFLTSPILYFVFVGISKELKKLTYINMHHINLKGLVTSVHFCVWINKYNWTITHKSCCAVYLKRYGLFFVFLATTLFSHWLFSHWLFTDQLHCIEEKSLQNGHSLKLDMVNFFCLVFRLN